MYMMIISRSDPRMRNFPDKKCRENENRQLTFHNYPLPAKIVPFMVKYVKCTLCTGTEALYRPYGLS